MWRSTGRRCEWETSSGCGVTRSSRPTSCCWAPVTRTACATLRPPHWTERPTWSRGRSSAASLTWWVYRFLFPSWRDRSVTHSGSVLDALVEAKVHCSYNTLKVSCVCCCLVYSGLLESFLGWLWIQKMLWSESNCWSFSSHPPAKSEIRFYPQEEAKASVWVLKR